MADWKKIILENDAAALANVTASGTVTLTSGIPDGSTAHNVLTIDTAGVVHSILQASVDGTDTTYDAGLGLTLGGAGNLTFSVVPGAIDHNSLDNHDPLEHILWGTSNATYNIDPANYTNNTYTNGQGIDIAGSGESHTFSTLPNQSHVTQVGALQAGSIVSGFGAIYTSGNIYTTGNLAGASLSTGGNFTVLQDASVGGTLTVANVTASNVGITGSLTVDGSLIFNGETFAEVIADTMTGSTSWGTDSTSNHYFTGSITASGTISASAFHGSGAGLTGISNNQLNLLHLSATNGLQLSGADYNGFANSSISIKNDTTGNDTLKLSGAGLRIKDGGVDTAQLAANSVTTAKIAAGAISGQKLAAGIIQAHDNTTSVTGTNELLLSTGTAGNEVLKALSIAQLATYMDSTYLYTANTGSVTSVTATGAQDGLSLGLQAGTYATTAPVIELSGTISIDNDNWTDGVALTFANGGTGQTSASGAANALMNQNLGSAFVIGDGNDTIIIPGSLTVLGDATNINSTNLEITDRFILIGSGSTGFDTGIQFGETAAKPNMLFWDSAYDSNTGRFGVATGQTTLASGGATNTDVTAAFHLAACYEGTTGNAAGANAQQVGNIVIDSGVAYIYA
jgi:hypothetical protein